MKPTKSFTKCNLGSNKCYCDGCFDDDDDYMLEKLYDMKNDIDFMIQVLEHRQEKEQACQNILSYEDECEYDDCEENNDDKIKEDFLESIEKIIKDDSLKRFTPIYTYPWTINRRYPYYTTTWYTY